MAGLAAPAHPPPQIFPVPPGQQLLRGEPGETLDSAAFLAYETFGELNALRDNAILFVTCYGERTSDASVTAMVEPSADGDPPRFDTSRYFVVVVNMLGNGLSFSPTTPGAWPRCGITYFDNAQAQRLLLTSLGVDKLALIYGFSMGAMIALQWAVQFPQDVAAVVAVCGTAKTGAANTYFLEQLQRALRDDPEAKLAEVPGGRDAVVLNFGGNPNPQGLTTYADIYSDWVFDGPTPTAGGKSPDAGRPDFARAREGACCFRDGLYKEKFGVESESAFAEVWRDDFRGWDAVSHWAVSSTWLHGDVSANLGDTFGGDLSKALGSIDAKVVMLPGSTDQYFLAEEAAFQAAMIPRGECVVLPSPMGHVAERMADMQGRINAAIAACLAVSGVEEPRM